MRITIKPDEIIKRCCWDSYVYYILSGDNKIAEEQLLNNNELDISEKDALVMGLLKIIETTNLIHKFNTYLQELLVNKSSKDGDNIYIRTKIVEGAIDKFMSKFPEYWEPNVVWSKALKELNSYAEELKNNIDKLEIINITIKNINYEMYNTNNFKKLLKFNY